MSIHCIMYNWWDFVDNVLFEFDEGRIFELSSRYNMSILIIDTSFTNYMLFKYNLTIIIDYTGK